MKNTSLIILAFYAKVFVAITVPIIEMKKIFCLLFIIVLEFAIS